jgi:RNA polymerase subunit RPABC4/transcription elongation factor Spt4
MERYKKCPSCKHTSTTEHWDANTKEIENIAEGRPYVSCNETKEKMAEEQSFFRCPICDSEVQGTDLLEPTTDNK